MTYTLEVQENAETGELYLQFSDDMLAHLGWHAGDELAWIDNGDGTWTLTPQTLTP